VVNKEKQPMMEPSLAPNVIQLAAHLGTRKNTMNSKTTTGQKKNTRVFAITSGKGGVGKTNIVANLGYALTRLGKKVLIFDADLGLGNLDVMLGIAPRFNLSHVISGEKHIDEILIEGPGSMQILPAASGIQELTRLTSEQKRQVLSDLDQLMAPIDVLLIDTAAGISSNVLYFNVAAQEIMVVVCPEPASITDAYALMKVLALNYAKKKFCLLVNQVQNPEEGHDVYRQLSMVTDKFLSISLEYMGYVLSDKNLTRSVRRQRVAGEMFPQSEASRCFATLARKVCNRSPIPLNEGSNFFWQDLVANKFD
jgi:flagellar biosynthesis protein FlhG